MTDEQTGERSRRISITKLQRQTAAGAELISLCQTITEDGRLSDEEVTALRQWVDDHISVDLPARDFLLETVRRIIEDGKVSDEERAELYQAIEKVLPPDIRADVRGKRRESEEAAEAVERSQREAQAQVERDAKRRNRPIGSWNFMVAGCRLRGASGCNSGLRGARRAGLSGERSRKPIQPERSRGQASQWRSGRLCTRGNRERGRSIAGSGAAPHRRSYQGPPRRANTNPRRAGADLQRRRQGYRSRS